MRKILLFSIILFSTFGVEGQDICVPDTLSGRFTQKREIREAGVTLRSEGSFSIDKSKGIKWVTEKPIKNTIALSPDAPMEGGEAARQVATIMRSLLVQDYAVLSRYFEVTRIKKRNGFGMRLKTTDETIAGIFTEIVITGEKYVKTVTLSNRQGDLTTISFTDVRESGDDSSTL
jgi:hypothetical protein